MMGKKITIQLAASAIAALMAFLSLTVSARLFGAKILGEVAYLSGLLGLVFAFSDLGLSRAHVRFTAANRPRPAAGSFVWLKLILLIFCAGIALALGGINRQLSWLFLTLLFFELVFRLADSLLINFEGYELVWPQNLVRLTGKFVRLAAVIFTGLILKTGLAYGLTFLIEAVIILVLAWSFSRRLWRWTFEPKVIKEYLSYSLPFALVMPLSYFQDNGLILIIRRFYSAEMLGIYIAVFGLFGLLKSLSASLMVFFFPRVSRLNQQGDMVRIQSQTDTAVKFSFWLLAPLVLILLLSADWLISLFLGSSFTGGAAVFRWLAVGAWILALFSPYDHVLFAGGWHRPIIAVNLITTILVLLFAWFVVPGQGISGAALALVIGWLISGIWQFLILKQKTGIRFLRDWRLTGSEVKYLYGLLNSFGQAHFWLVRKKAG